jgi:Na+/melibiose symporter-like transporter
MVGDICDEDELKTGNRSEGSFYSIFWWFIKLGTALASFVAGALIVFTMFDETQVTKVDALQGSIRELRAEAQSRQEGKAPEENLQELFKKALVKSSELKSHLETKTLETKNSPEHYDVIMQNITGVNERLENLDTTLTPDLLDQELSHIEEDIVPLTQQTPYTLLMMRIVEIGLPVLLSLFSIFFVLRYSLTEKRSHEIKDLLKKRNEERSIQ